MAGGGLSKGWKLFFFFLSFFFFFIFLVSAVGVSASPLLTKPFSFTPLHFSNCHQTLEGIGKAPALILMKKSLFL